MSEYAPQASNHTNRLDVVAWNILLNRVQTGVVAPQHERIDSHAKTLLEHGRGLDVVSLSEVEATKVGHNGKYIASAVGGSEGSWTRHSRRGEYIGMFGRRVEDAEFIDLGHNKSAVMTKIGRVSIAATHLKFQLYGPERAEQMATLLEKIGDEEQGIIMGDFNCLAWQRPRRMMEEAGYQSVFDVLDIRRPVTVPMKQYRPMLSASRRIAVGRGLSIDDIYVKNLQVYGAGSFVGDSDHAGVWASVATSAEDDSYSS